MIDARRSHLALYLALGYTLLILYASLSPFIGWRDPGVPALAFLTEPWQRYISEFDLAVNVLAYLPLGFLVALIVLPAGRPWSACVLGTLCGIAVSFAMELAQGYLPARVSSNIDLAANALGALVGAGGAARVGALPAVTRRLARWRDRWFLPGRLVDLGIALIALWFFSQLDPSVPLLGIVFFSDGVQAQLAGLSADGASRILGPIAVGMNLIAVGLLLMLTMRSMRSALAAIALLVCVAALIKLIAATALLKSEAAFLWVSQDVALAIAAGAVVIALALWLRRPAVRALCALALLGVIALALFKPGEATAFLSLRLFRWSYLQLLHYTGLAAAVTEAWPYAALAYLGLVWRNDRRTGH